MAITNTVLLPTEIWIRVLENLKKERGWLDAWISCRHVSTTFKDVVETIFRERHLPKTAIIFELGQTRNSEGIRVVLDSAFEFDRLSEDRKTAVFKMDPGEKRYHTILRNCLHDAVRGTRIDASTHTVQFRRLVKDTPLPALTMNYGEWELSLDWCELYTRFWGEENIYVTNLQKFVKEKEAWALEMRGKMERGELDMMAVMMRGMNTLADGHFEAKRIARRARIRQQYREKGAFDYDLDFIRDEDEEKSILEKLKEQEFDLRFAEYSDDEDEPEEKEEEEVGRRRRRRGGC